MGIAVKKLVFKDFLEYQAGSVAGQYFSVQAAGGDGLQVGNLYSFNKFHHQDFFRGIFFEYPGYHYGRIVGKIF